MENNAALDLINQVSKTLGHRLEELTELNFFQSDPGLYFDVSGNVVGLNLSGLNLNDERFGNLLTKYHHSLLNIRFLDLSRNALVNPFMVGVFGELRKIDLALNFIEDLTFLVRLPNLESLNLRCNQIKKIPDSFFDGDLEVKFYDDWNGGLVLEGNPIDGENYDLMVEKIEQQRVAKYEQLMKHGVYSRNECRVQLIGSGGAGKTTLAKSLAGVESLSNEAATRGMAIWEATLDDVRVKLWDFGGQEAMYSVHRLFIASGNLFIIVLDSRHNEAAEGWVDFILSFSSNAKIIIVLNKIDENRSYDLDRKTLWDKFPKNILSIHKISAIRRNEGKFLRFVDDLKKELAVFASSELPLKFQPLLRSFELDTQPLYSFEELEELFESGGLEKSEKKLALDQLMRLGIVISEEIRTYGRVLIRSRWLAKKIYPLLEPDVGNFADNGVVGITDLRKVWDDIATEDNSDSKKSLSSDSLFMLILEVMEKQDLCQLISDEKVFIPNFLPSEAPSIQEYYEGSAKHLTIVFKCNFLPKLMFQRLHVELERGFKVLVRWKAGMVLTGESSDYKGKYHCIISGDFHKSKIRITSLGLNRTDGLRDAYRVVKRNLRYVEQIDIEEYLVYTEAQPGTDAVSKYELSFKDIMFHSQQGVDQYLSGEYQREFSIPQILTEIPAELIEDPVDQRERQQVNRILAEITSLRQEIVKLKNTNSEKIPDAEKMLIDLGEIDRVEEGTNQNTQDIKNKIYEVGEVVRKMDGYSKNVASVTARIARLAELLTFFN